MPMPANKVARRWADVVVLTYFKGLPFWKAVEYAKRLRAIGFSPYSLLN